MQVEETIFLTFSILWYAWSSHAFTYNKKDGVRMFGDCDTPQFPCTKTVSQNTSHKWAQSRLFKHQEGGILCSSVCLFGKYSFFFYVTCMLFFLFSEQKIQHVMYIVMFVLLGLSIVATMALNFPMFVRSIPAYVAALCLIYINKPV